MTSLTLSKASINYHSGRFKHTADDIGNAIEELKNETLDAAPHGKIIFAALPHLAFKADKSMCTFRSQIMSSPADEATLQEQLSIASDENEQYLMALQGCICSLYLKSNHSDNKTAAQNTSPDTDVCGILIIDRDRLQLAMAVIMTAISNSWLHLQQTQRNSQEIAMAGAKVQKGISLAACCFVAHNPKSCRPTWMEGLNIIQRAQSRAENNTLYASEVKRMTVALRHLNHALKLVDLLMASKSTTQNNQVSIVTHTKNRKKRQREHEVVMAQKHIKSTNENKNLENDEYSSNDKSKLAMQEHLIKALRYHLQDLKQDRDKFMQMAMGIEDSGMTGKLKVIFQATDFLDLNAEDASSAIYRATDFIQSLSSLSATSTSMSFLLGCVYAKMQFYDKALASFESAMRLYTHSNHANLSDYKDIVYNTAHCCIEKGDIDVALEVLLHWIDIENNASNHTSTSTDQAQPCLVCIDNDKQSQTSKLLSVLYRIFFAASLLNDWETCQSAIDALTKLSTDEILLLANQFVDLERSVSNGDNIEQEEGEDGESIYTLGKSLYQTELRLVRLGRQSSAASTSTGITGLDEEHIPKEMDRLLSIWTHIKSEIPLPLQNRIESCIYNNLGISSISNGKPLESIPHFLQAIKSLPSDNFLPVFNLSLALWSQGSKHEACRLYLEKRGHKVNLLSAHQGEKESLSLDLEKAQIDLEDIKNRKTGGGMEKDFLALDICMMKYALKVDE